MHASFHGHVVEYEKSKSDLLLVSKAPSSIPSSHNKESSPSSSSLLCAVLNSELVYDAENVDIWGPNKLHGIQKSA